jgi:hypothetical protein
MKESFFRFIGWYGVLAVLAAYVLLNLSFFDAKNIFYQILNFTGALAIVFSSLRKKDYPPAVLNLTWALVAFFVLIRIVLDMVF